MPDMRVVLEDDALVTAQCSPRVNKHNPLHAWTGNGLHGVHCVRPGTHVWTDVHKAICVWIVIGVLGCPACSPGTWHGLVNVKPPMHGPEDGVPVVPCLQPGR